MRTWFWVTIWYRYHGWQTGRLIYKLDIIVFSDWFDYMQYREQRLDIFLQAIFHYPSVAFSGRLLGVVPLFLPSIWKRIVHSKNVTPSTKILFARLFVHFRLLSFSLSLSLSVYLIIFFLLSLSLHVSKSVYSKNYLSLSASLFVTHFLSSILFGFANISFWSIVCRDKFSNSHYDKCKNIFIANPFDGILLHGTYLGW